MQYIVGLILPSESLQSTLVTMETTGSTAMISRSSTLSLEPTETPSPTSTNGNLT